MAWLKQRGGCLEVEREALEQGEIIRLWEALLAKPKKPLVEPDGVWQAADCLKKILVL